MAAGINDKLLKVGVAGTLTSLSAPGHAIAGTTITVGSTTNWPTDTAVIFGIRRVDADGLLIPGTYTEWRGVVSGSTLTNMVLMYGTDQVYTAGSTTQVFIPVSSARDNRLIDALLEVLNQDATLKDGVVSTASKIADGIITKAKLAAGAVIGDNGWYTDTDTWVYVSANSFKIVGQDRTSKFPFGTKIWLNQSGSKYFYVTNATFSTDTTVTVTAGTDYTIANATITAPYYSYAANPQGFPQSFPIVPVWQNVTLGSSTNTGRFTINGKTVTYWYALTFGAGSSVSGAINVDFPVTASSNAHTPGQSIGGALLNDNGIGNYWGPAIYISTSQFTFYVPNGSGDARMTQANNGKPGTWNSGDSIFGHIIYQAA